MYCITNTFRKTFFGVKLDNLNTLQVVSSATVSLPSSCKDGLTGDEFQNLMKWVHLKFKIVKVLGLVRPAWWQKVGID